MLGIDPHVQWACDTHGDYYANYIFLGITYRLSITWAYITHVKAVYGSTSRNFTWKVVEMRNMGNPAATGVASSMEEAKKKAVEELAKRL